MSSSAFRTVPASADVVIVGGGVMGVSTALGSGSLRAYQDFPGRPGADIRLDTVGYLFLLDSEQQASDFEAGVKLLNSLGVPSRMIGPDQAPRLCGYIGTDVLVAAASPLPTGTPAPRWSSRATRGPRRGPAALRRVRAGLVP